jgi:predicted flap endonuclease-1-like 5' DNA nuclease
MNRRIVGFIVGMVVAFAGVFFFGWVLWWLWKRLSEQEPPATIEIEAPISEPVIEVPTEIKTRAPEPPPGPDDLKRIEGIGPRYSSVLQAAGITTYIQLAAASPDELHQILEAEDPRLARLADPTSWPEQAALAAAGNWEGLDGLRQRLKGGRQP